MAEGVGCGWPCHGDCGSCPAAGSPPPPFSLLSPPSCLWGGKQPPGLSLHAAPWLKRHPPTRNATDSPAGAEGSSRSPQRLFPRLPGSSTRPVFGRRPQTQWLQTYLLKLVEVASPGLKLLAGQVPPGASGALWLLAIPSFQSHLRSLARGPFSASPQPPVSMARPPFDKDPLTVVLGPARWSQTTRHRRLPNLTTLHTPLPCEGARHRTWGKG